MVYANNDKKMQHIQTFSCVLGNMIHLGGFLRLLAGCTALRPLNLAVKLNHLFALSETRAFDFLHGFSAVESRRVLHRHTHHYMLDPERGVAMLEDLANRLRSGCPEGSNAIAVLAIWSLRF